MRLRLLTCHILRGVAPQCRCLSSSTPTASAGSEALATESACFGAGCFWGTEKYFKVDFPLKYPKSGTRGSVSNDSGSNSNIGGNILDVRVGYMGPSTAKANPTYSEVCSGTSQHVEVCGFRYTGGERVFENLCRHFFSFHDPTTENRQGFDIGPQYNSVIYYHTPLQQEVAKRIKAEFQTLLDRKGVRYSGPTVQTAILPATIFYEAEGEHQQYLERHPGGYCNHFYRL